MLLQKARDKLGWELDLGTIALTWRGGCIIRRWALRLLAHNIANRTAAMLILLFFTFPLPVGSCRTSKMPIFGTQNSLISSSIPFSRRLWTSARLVKWRFRCLAIQCTFRVDSFLGMLAFCCLYEHPSRYSCTRNRLSFGFLRCLQNRSTASQFDPSSTCFEDT